MKQKNFLIFFGVLILVFIGSIIYDLIKIDVDRKKIAAFDLQLSGKIIGKKDFFYGHDYGFVLIDLKKTNYGDYDPRNKNDDYFFVIKNNKCVLVLSGLSEVEIGDSIAISKSKYDIYRKEKTISKSSDLVLLSSIYCDNPNTLLDKASR